jgi:hypothetical protein
MTTSAAAEFVDLTAEDDEEEEEELGTCPVCGDALPVELLQEHADAHFAAADGPPADAACGLGERVECSRCGARVPLEDLESHELAHAFSSSPPRAPGAALQRAAGAAAAQRPDPQWPGPPGGAGWALVHRLAAALAAEWRAGPPPPPGARAAAALLCGPVAPFGGRPGDAGWGCGYRNIQVVASHLLAASPNAAAALFGGARFVPDIASLQGWIEAAWAAGFDAPGAAQLGGGLRGTQTWIGATEAAACLRQFGLRAAIVDFGVALDGAAVRAAPTDVGLGLGGQEVHAGATCSGCGAAPIIGARYRSEVLPGADYCSRCAAPGGAASAAGAAAPLRRVPVLAYRSPAATAAKAAGASAAGQALLEWCWRYFRAAADGAGAPAAAAAAGGVRLTAAAPLFFQHQGHSRVIVGVERRPRAGTAGAAGGAELSLLVLDPGTPPAALEAALAAAGAGGGAWRGLLRRTARALAHPAYQLVYVAAAELEAPGGAAFEELKVVAASERYAT